MGELANLPNLGRQSEKKLNTIGIFSEAELHSIGIVEAYLRLKKAFPGEVNLMFLWALEGALSRSHWEEIPAEVKVFLKNEVESRQLSDIPVIELLNIGKGLAKYLQEIGVKTRSDLERIGAAEAWKQIKNNYPQKDCCVCALYALEGALAGIRWHKLPQGVKKKCLQFANQQFPKSKTKKRLEKKLKSN